MKNQCAKHNENNNIAVGSVLPDYAVSSVDVRTGRSPELNKFEKVSSDSHQMSLARSGDPEVPVQ